MNFLKQFRANKPLTLGLLTCALGLILALPAPAAELAFAGGNNLATNRAVVIVSAKGNSGGETPSIRWLSATSDLATAVITFYRSGAPVKIAFASPGGTNRVVFDAGFGTQFATSNQVLVVRHVATDIYERLVSFTNTSTTVTFTSATASAVAVGDEVTIQTADATYLTGAATVNIQHPEGIYHGLPSRPLLFEITGTTLCKIPLYSGRFWRPPP
jgi:hypothetical protein